MNGSEVMVMSSECWQWGVFFKVDVGEGRDPYKKDLVSKVQSPSSLICPEILLNMFLGLKVR